MTRLSRKEYADLLCKTIEKYDFPKVTYDFAKDPDYEHKDNQDNQNPHRKDNPHAHDCMRAVEKYIGDLLHSEDTKSVKDGLANVLYWGHARQGYRDTRVNKFRNAELENKLKEFVQLARELAGSSIVPSAGDLLKIRDLGIPQFGRVSFASKILMFLDPARYPVLDWKIANAYAKKPDFPPLQNLTFSINAKSIRITERNTAVYDTWACWCREISRVVNEVLEPPYHVRAVDVERALFTLADINDVRLLLAGPAG